MDTFENSINAAFLFLSKRLKHPCDTGIILGSGLGSLLQEMKLIQEFPYAEIPHFPISTVEGHSGKLILGELEGKMVLAMSGRFHFYENYGMKAVTFPLRVLRTLGVEKLVITNAAGGLNPDFQAGDLMLIEDIISLFPDNPLRGKNLGDYGPRFPDMSESLDSEWMKLALDEAVDLRIDLKKGIYAGVPGPKLETKAEVRFLRIIGADAVGMSTVPEIIIARHMGLKTIAFSVITNESIPKVRKEFTHADVVEVADRAGKQLALLVKRIL
ncbi:Purine nucleoside phosphorylase [Indibacter alkaliphilus LW1]|uniref:Purine nucleoside phosphorylase n=1 Tax=Indibacter alkaliphilus (strain CCUG 57479 / KCTC 22604 / LW1) TaxID=1189612 RepID=S2EBT2_INDAL|nr:purine-nucleoside phosphorylase [Indibacter alkaliphilus]EOZ99818.1 Purine nucleoside phosphorylase [Indibacter alkaliphilus LW1]